MNHSCICGRPVELGVRCPHCGARCEEKKIDPLDAIRDWDRKILEAQIQNPNWKRTTTKQEGKVM